MDAVQKGAEEVENDQDMFGMIPVSEVEETVRHGKLRGVQRICGKGGKPVSNTVFDVVYLANCVVTTKNDRITLDKSFSKLQVLSKGRGMRNARNIED